MSGGGFGNIIFSVAGLDNDRNILSGADLICVQRGPEKVSAGLLTIPSVAEIGPCAVRLLQKAVDQLID